MNLFGKIKINSETSDNNLINQIEKKTLENQFIDNNLNDKNYQRI